VFGGVNYDGWNCFTGRMRTEEEWRWGLENFRKTADYGLAQAPERSKSLAKDIWNFLTSRHSPWVA
jgi:hypothetical protein